MANNDIKIPFKYCRIDRAARFLNCDVSDLINLGLEYKISLCAMMDGVKSEIYIDANLEDALKWRENLAQSYAYLAYTQGITEYSFFSFDILSCDENDNLIKLPYFYYNEDSNCCFSCIGKAFGLWRLTRGLDKLLNYGVNYISGYEFAPCMSDKLNLAKQLIIHKKYDKTEDEMTDEEYRNIHRSMSITANDLWITAYDVRRLLNSQGDYYLLDNFYETEILLTDTKTKKIHHSAERHATNREHVLMAAMRYREENIKSFDNNCRKSDGSINFSAWAREILQRPFLFLDNEIKIKTEDKVAAILSNAYKVPSERN
ncbi:hypothetical protein [Photorhabdus heterorhabditis]|uniref:Uncharacterized protein n=1 Tax=Photorhabdus heterorhabditis TaxID=880156 RepID=A0A5B0X9D0_9GAMM|nr:hypothetical protein [Photorhabdus heterorhabditis]KAA1195067.1 hypothetical protein F0L16_03305 [Photorhabdus heterorhabditis]